MNAGSWSAEHVPTSEDVVCVPTGATATLEGGMAAVELLQGDGNVTIESGSLAVFGTTEMSNIGTLRLDGGALKGAGTLFVTASLIGDGGAMEGAGTTVVGAKAAGVVSDPGPESHVGLRLFGKHVLRNAGEMHVNGPAATLAILEGSTLENSSRVEVLGAEAAIRENEGRIVNSGELLGEGAEAELRAEGGTIENESQLRFLPAGSRIRSSGGANLENSGQLTAQVLQGSGKVTNASGSLTISGTAEDSNIGTLRLDGGALKGAGRLFVTASLIGDGGAMEGAGTTVVGAEATATVSDPETENHVGLRLLDKHILKNGGELHVNGPAATFGILEGSTFENISTAEVLGSEGTLRESGAHILNSGDLIAAGAAAEIRAEGGSVENEAKLALLPSGTKIKGSEDAFLENSGELLIDGEGKGYGLVAGAGEAPRIKNTGTLRKGSGEYESLVEYKTNNLGHIEAEAGELAFVAGGASGAGEKSWGDGYEEGEVVFDEGTFTLGDTVVIRGEVRILKGAQISAGQFKAGGSWIRDEEGTLKIGTSEAATQFGRLDLIGSDLLVPSEQTAGAEFLGLAEGNLTVGTDAHWTKGYVEQVAGDIEARPGARFEAGYIEQMTGNIAIASEARFLVGYVEKHGGSVDVKSGAVMEVESGWDQLEGTLTVAAGVNFKGGTGYWHLADGSQSFGAGLEHHVNYLGQEGGELSFGSIDNLEVNDWNHVGGSTTIGGESTISTSAFEQRADTAELGAGSTITDGFLGVYGGELVANSEAIIAGGAVSLNGGTLDLEASSRVILNSNLQFNGGQLLGNGDTHTASLTMISGNLGGDGTSTVAGTTWIEPEEEGATTLSHRTLETAGQVIFESGDLGMGSGAEWDTAGAFAANAESGSEAAQIYALGESGHASRVATPILETNEPRIVNTGSVEKTKGSGTTTIQVAFENYGVFGQKSGHLNLEKPVQRSSSEKVGTECSCNDPVNPATGDLTERQTDISSPNWGKPLELTRTYSAQAAALQTSPGPFGYGWSSNYEARLDKTEGHATVLISSGDQIPFTETAPGDFAGPGWSQSQLIELPSSAFEFITAEDQRFVFLPGGALSSVIDIHGNKTSLEYDETGELSRVSAESGRSVSFTYDSAGFVATAENFSGEVTTYAYKEGQLHSVTRPGEYQPQWRFNYDGHHRLEQMVEGPQEAETESSYDANSKVELQVDPMGNRTDFAYEPFRTTITNQGTGTVTEEWYTSNNEPFKLVSGAGSAVARTEMFKYDPRGLMLSRIDGDEHETKMAYDAGGNETSVTNAEGQTTSWTYNGRHEPLTETTPSGLVTTFVRSSNGDIDSISRSAAGLTTEATSYTYNSHGAPLSFTNALGNTWEFTYDGFGDKTSESDPVGDVETFSYNSNGKLEYDVSPKGNEVGRSPGERREYSVRYNWSAANIVFEERALSTSTVVLLPSGKLYYAADGDASVRYENDKDERLKEVAYSDVGFFFYTYDGAGNIETETDQEERVTQYVRDALGQVTEKIAPSGGITRYSYDGAGNLMWEEDAAGRVTECTYDQLNRLISIAYEDPETPDVELSYTLDGQIASMSDGTGLSTYEYDGFGRLIGQTDGSGEQITYGYNSGDEISEIRYPNGKTVHRSFDVAGRLSSVTDWSGRNFTFGYDRDSNLASIDFPASTKNSDDYQYGPGDLMSQADFDQSGKTIAALNYAENLEGTGLPASETQSGLPGAEEVSFGFENDRLTSANTETFSYGATGAITANGEKSYSYNEAAELVAAGSESFEYDATGERIKALPEEGQPTDYQFDQAGNLTHTDRSPSGESPGLHEALSFDGSGLMTARQDGEVAEHLTWSAAEGNSALLQDGQDSFVYGPNHLPLEQIDKAGAATFYHHDRLGSTRLLTNESGNSVGALSYGAFGRVEESPGAESAPFKFDGQYTFSGSGLQYLKRRVYDPGTQQFLSADPLAAVTREPYAYALGDPVQFGDPHGLGPCVFGFIACDEDEDPCGSVLNVLKDGFMAGACLVPPQAEQPIVEVSAGYGDAVLSPIPFVSLPVNGPSIRKMLGIDNVEQSCALYQGTKLLFELKSLKNIGEFAKLPQAGRDLSRGLDEKFVFIPDLF